jgi:ATP-dependent exoDNAse (exonuclease V) alpha subunit
VLLIDEASLLGTRTLAQVFDLTGKLDSRVILVGDSRQHRSVERGSAFDLLQKRAAVPVEVTDIRRQEGRARQAILALSQGRVRDGFDLLDDMGCIAELPDGVREQRVAQDYLAVSREKRPNGEDKSVLVVSPTHAEGEHITTAIRQALRADGRLGEERDLAVWTPLRLTQAERSDATNLLPGDMLQFHRNAPGHRSGSRTVLREGQEPPVTYADRYQAYRPAALRVAISDRLRVTANGKTKDGKHRLNNGAILTVQGFTSAGDVVVDKGWVIAKEFGHLAHGYFVTSHASQGKSVDRVLVAQSSLSLPASSPEQFYVSASRGKSITIYTDDKKALLDAIGQARRGRAASERTPLR